MKPMALCTSVIRSLVLAAVTASLLSFVKDPGGDSFSISLNDRLLHQQHLTSKSDVKTIRLGNTEDDDQLRIYFSECGKIGTGRAIHIRDQEGKTLKRFTFRNSAGKEHAPMSFRVKELPTTSAGIAYSSDLMLTPVLLVRITTSDESLTSKK